jgi:hypothetical protein
MRRWGVGDDESLLPALLDVEDSVSLVGRHLCANDFESEVICQPIVRRQLIIILFASCALKHCESKLQKTLCRVKVCSLQRYAHLTNFGY